MSYNSVVEMAANEALRLRIVACAAAEGISNPDTWVRSYLWSICASPGWDTAWDSALTGWTPPVMEERAKKGESIDARSQDPGSKEDVITDGMILAAIQAVTTVT